VDVPWTKRERWRLSETSLSGYERIVRSNSDETFNLKGKGIAIRLREIFGFRCYISTQHETPPYLCRTPNAYIVSRLRWHNPKLTISSSFHQRFRDLVLQCPSYNLSLNNFLSGRSRLHSPIRLLPFGQKRARLQDAPNPNRGRWATNLCCLGYPRGTIIMPGLIAITVLIQAQGKN
jgi:hypothetical protein